MEEQRRPEVTLTASSAPLRAQEPVSAPVRRRRRPVVLLALPAAALAVVVGTRTPAPPQPPPPFEVELVLLADRVSLSQSGVLVLPLELRNSGPAVTVQRAGAYASPVVADPVLEAPEAVARGAHRRGVVLVAPDCRLLGPGSALDFSAAVLLRVGQGSVSRDVVLDLSGTTAVRRLVAGLCSRPRTPS